MNVHKKIENNILYISLSRQEVRNAFNPSLIGELREAFLEVRTQPHLKAVIFRGLGKAFCAGADLGWMKSMAQYSEEDNLKDSEYLFEMFESIRSCPVPVITWVHGAAFGGALGLIAASDFVIAEEQTQLCFSEVKIGLVPAVISAFVQNKISLSQISHFMISGMVFKPQQVLGSLVHHLVKGTKELNDDQLFEIFSAASKEIVHSLMQAGPEAIRETKKLTSYIDPEAWAQTKKRVCESIARRRVSSEGQEGLSSFFEKRRPSWV